MQDDAAGRKASFWRDAMPKLKLGWASLPVLTDHDDQAWLDHVRVGELFNRAVANAHLSAYYNSAIRALGQEWARPGHGLLDRGSEYDIDYVLPGDVPDSEADRIAYWWLFQAVKAEDDLVDEVSRALERLAPRSAKRDLAGRRT